MAKILLLQALTSLSPIQSAQCNKPNSSDSKHKPMCDTQSFSFFKCSSGDTYLISENENELENKTTKEVQWRELNNKL
jgi:hypothetical protein